MKEYFLFIHVEAQVINDLLEDESYMKKVHLYINSLASKGNMIDVKPLKMEGMVLSAANGKLVETPYNNKLDGLAGCIHLRAANFNEVLSLAKEHPLLEVAKGDVEIRPVRMVS